MTSPAGAVGALSRRVRTLLVAGIVFRVALGRDPDRSTLLVDFGLGNQWQWSFFTAGIDWVQLSVPVYTRAHVPAGAALAAADRAPAAHGPGRLEWEWLRFYVGLTF